MKAVILAAGIGTRLLPYTKNTPKCLLKVADKELLDFQLDALYFCNINDISIVTGHFADKVKNKAGNRARCIFNPLYNQGGILLSFQAAKDYLYGHEFVYLASDIIFHPEILKMVLNTKGDIVIGVEEKECDEEDSKALIKNEEIIKMGKEINKTCDDESITEFVHIAKFSKRGSISFFDSFIDIIKGDNNAYMMDALNLVSKMGVKLTPAYVKSLPRIEIDFPEDLQRAEKIYKRFNNF